MQNTESQNLEIRYLKYDKRTGVFRFSFLKRIEDIYTLDVLVPMIINGFYRDINQQTNTRSGLFEISLLY